MAIDNQLTTPASTNPDLIKIAISVGVDRTQELMGRQNTLGQKTRSLVAGNISISIAGESRRLVKEDGKGLLIVLGCPVRTEGLTKIGCAEDTTRIFTKAEGAFAAIYLDKITGSLTIITDFLGVQPLYYMQTRGEVHFASETKAFAADPDPGGWGAFLAFGHPIGDTTLARNVTRVPGGSIARIKDGTPNLDIQSYWSPPDPGPAPSMTAVADEFRASIQDYAPFGRDGTILLSGGFDSRLVLFGLLEAGIPVTARIFAHADENLDADRHFATRLARKFGLKFDVVHPAKDYFSTPAYLDYLSDTDAQTRSLHLYIAQLTPHIPGPTIWEGWGPGPTLGSRYFPGGGLRAYLDRSCAFPGSTEWEAAKLILKQDYLEEVEKSFSALLDHELARCTDDEFGVYWFFSRNRSRNRTGANTFKAFPQHATPCLPGLSKGFWSTAASIPQANKLNHQYFTDFLKTVYPAALSVPFVTGATLMPGHPYSPYYHLFSAGAGAQNFVSKRPRLRRILPVLGRGHTPIEKSAWLSKDLLGKADGYIDERAISKLSPDDPLYSKALTFLFHWKAWNWLHEGRLKENFQIQ